MGSILNIILVYFARIFGLSPGIVHVILLGFVTIAFGALNPESFSVFFEAFFNIMWFGLCAIVVLVTWLTKGKYRPIWWKAEYWKNGIP